MGCEGSASDSFGPDGLPSEAVESALVAVRRALGVVGRASARNVQLPLMPEPEDAHLGPSRDKAVQRHVPCLPERDDELADVTVADPADQRMLRE